MSFWQTSRTQGGTGLEIQMKQYYEHLGPLSSISCFFPSAVDQWFAVIHQGFTKPWPSSWIINTLKYVEEGTY